LYFGRREYRAEALRRFAKRRARWDFKAALAIQDKLVPLQVATFLEAGVTGAKYGLSLLGKVGEEVRLPLVPSTQATKDRIRAAMVFAGLLEA